MVVSAHTAKNVHQTYVQVGTVLLPVSSTRPMASTVISVTVPQALNVGQVYATQPPIHVCPTVLRLLL